MPQTLEIILTTASCAIMLICVGCRCASRFLILRRYALHDLLLLTGAVGSLCSAACYWSGLKYGPGPPNTDLPEASVRAIKLFGFFFILIYAASLTCIKLSFATLYLTLVVEWSHRYFCWFLIVFNIVYNAATFMAFIFSCNPVSHRWDFTSPGSCHSVLPSWLANAACDVLADFSLAVFPFWFLGNLNLPRRSRWWLMFVLSLGGTACIWTVVRFKSMLLLGRTNDDSRYAGVVVMWCTLELNTGIICACLPMMGPLFKWLGEHRHAGSSNSQISNTPSWPSKRTARAITTISEVTEHAVATAEDQNLHGFIFPSEDLEWEHHGRSRYSWFVTAKTSC